LAQATTSYATTFEVNLATLFTAGDTITVDNIGGNQVAATATPTLAHQTATQTWKIGQSVNFSLGSDTFTAPVGDSLIYHATLADGSQLPTWLSFDSATDTFSGTVSQMRSTSLSITVTATDSAFRAGNLQRKHLRSASHPSGLRVFQRRVQRGGLPTDPIRAKSRGNAVAGHPEGVSAIGATPRNGPPQEQCLRRITANTGNRTPTSVEEAGAAAHTHRPAAAGPTQARILQADNNCPACLWS
jgi:hypothetical protein